jgi:ribosomal protein L10
MATQSEIKKLLSSKHVADLPIVHKGETVIVTSKETPYDAFKVIYNFAKNCISK